MPKHLPERLLETGFDQPFMVTEWGTIGYWEMEKTRWGVPFETTSSEKADILARAHREILAPLEGQLIGSYVFFWGQKQERTPTWFGLLTEDGSETEAVDVVLAPVDGTFTLNVDDMISVLQDIQAPLVVPMHYFGQASLAAFLGRLEEHYVVELSDGPSVYLSRAALPRRPTVLVLPAL